MSISDRDWDRMVAMTPEQRAAWYDALTPEERAAWIAKARAMYQAGARLLRALG